MGFLLAFTLGASAWAQNFGFDHQNPVLNAQGKGATLEQAFTQARYDALVKAAEPWIHTSVEKNRFEQKKAYFMAHSQRYVSRLKLLKKVTLPENHRFIQAQYQIDLKRLKADLVQLGILESMQNLNESLGSPKLWVFAKTPWETHENDLWLVSRAHQYLIQNGFKLVDLNIVKTLKEEEKILSTLPSMLTQVSADMYLSLEIFPRITGKSGEYTYIEAPIQVKAYERLQEKPFLDKTYVPLTPKGEPKAFAIKGEQALSQKAVIEDAVGVLMPFIAQDILTHWKTHLLEGKSYTLTMTGLSPAQQQPFENLLKRWSPHFERHDKGQYTVFYRGSLENLTDQLERNTELPLELIQFSPHHAQFKVKD